MTNYNDQITRLREVLMEAVDLLARARAPYGPGEGSDTRWIADKVKWDARRAAIEVRARATLSEPVPASPDATSQTQLGGSSHDAR